MKRIFGIFLLLGMTAQGITAQGLKDTFAGKFKVGCSLSGHNLSHEQQNLIIKEFNSVTCENAMKPASVHPAEGVWRWEEADRIANFCRQNHIPMRGHCLVWHNQFSNWMMYDKEGNLVDKEVFYARLREHIHTVVKRYADIVYAWDVVNEAISDGGGSCPYRQSKLYQLCGDEFIAKAFIYAREADPKALLFYNDYNECAPHKRDRIYEMVLRMKADGVPIDGIGMQGHYNVFGPKPEELSAAIEKYSTLVDHIHITELDVRASEEMGGQLKFKTEGINLGDTIRALHKEQYGKLFHTLHQYANKIDCVSFWNLHDGSSWLGEKNYPLLFDRHLNRKPAYEAVIKSKQD